MDKSTHFKANAGLKDILGRGLIYDDNIAIIELVKNSQDADSPKVEIEFLDAETISEKSKLLIRDNGNGMDMFDIENKWLNMAYSEKKGTLKSNKEAYAGNKGIGRFSCDRLGSQLILYTKRKNSTPLKLYINWSDFENKTINDEVSSIPLKIEELSQEQFAEESGIESSSGTLLEIRQLRSEWQKKKYTNLIEELEKYSSNPDSTFLVYLNGKKIENKIFDKLSEKTTNIKSNISEDGSKLFATLYYQGDVVYSYETENPYKTLKNIEVEIHYLDTYSKSFFHKKTGYPTNDYGSIFLYHNGYRISPYGNPGNDWLGLDVRKSQGTKRYFSSREVIGKITINKDIDSFAIISSREGLVHNNAYRDLVAYEKDDKTVLKNGKSAYGYVINIFRQLETFVVEGLNWDGFYDKLDPESNAVIAEKNIKDDPQRYAPRPLDENKVKEAVNKVLNRPDYKIENLSINKDTIENIKQISENKYKDFTSKFIKSSGNKRIKDLSVYEQNNLKKIIEYEQQKAETAYKERDYAEERWQEAEEDKKVIEQKVKKHEKTIEQITSENFFLRTTSDQDLDDLLDCMHTISTAMDTIENEKSYFLEKNKPTKEMLEFFEYIDEPLKKIKNIAKYAILKNYKDKENPINADLVTFIRKHINEIKKYKSNQKITINSNLPDSYSINTKFIPLQIMTLVDNILSNSKKAKATVLSVYVKRDKQKISIIFEDNGQGLSDKINDINSIFEKGVTTTYGAGLGLYQVRKTIEHLGGKVIAHSLDKGFTIEVIFNEN